MLADPGIVVDGIEVRLATVVEYGHDLRTGRKGRRETLECRDNRATGGPRQKAFGLGEATGCHNGIQIGHTLY